MSVATFENKDDLQKLSAVSWIFIPNPQWQGSGEMYSEASAIKFWLWAINTFHFLAAWTWKSKNVILKHTFFPMLLIFQIW